MIYKTIVVSLLVTIAIIGLLVALCKFWVSQLGVSGDLVIILELGVGLFLGTLAHKIFLITKWKLEERSGW